jgi:hypothetical protein
VNRDVHDGHARRGSVTRASPKLLTFGRPSTPQGGPGSVLELIADRFRTHEVIRYEAALRGNAAYLTSLDAPTR